MNIELSESTLPKRIGAYIQEKAPAVMAHNASQMVRGICLYAETYDSVEAALDDYFSLERHDNDAYREEIQNFFCSLSKAGFYPEITYFDNEDYEVYQLNDAFEKYYDLYADHCGGKANLLQKGLEHLQEDRQVYVKRQSKVALITWVEEAHSHYGINGYDCFGEDVVFKPRMNLKRCVKAKSARQMDAS